MGPPSVICRLRRSHDDNRSWCTTRRAEERRGRCPTSPTRAGRRGTPCAATCATLRSQLPRVRADRPHGRRNGDQDPPLTLPPDQLVARRDLEDSSVLDLKTARALARTATTAALARAEIALKAVDAVVAVSCTGYAIPSIDVCLVDDLEVGSSPGDVHRHDDLVYVPSVTWTLTLCRSSDWRCNARAAPP